MVGLAGPKRTTRGSAGYRDCSLRLVHNVAFRLFDTAAVARQGGSGSETVRQ